MRRGEFIVLIGAAAALPLAARAQQPAMPVIGFIHGNSPQGRTHLIAAFNQGLKDNGFVEDRNLAIEYRWANGQMKVLTSLETITGPTKIRRRRVE
jgi:putative ABC transport system substrate-binding protein